MSVLNDIFLSIANMPVGGVKSRNVPDLSLAVPQTDLPLRLIMPPQSEGAFPAIGDLQRITHGVRDLCLWAPLDGNEGHYFQSMVDYEIAYILALRSLRSPADQCWISSFTFDLKPKPWGEGQYHAIDVLLTIEEAL